ncbi:acetylglutamate kinase [Salmonella enterica subsp. enterica]|uniref:Acetylglutamate kinase n=1 Tax=Salmonella enterica I TaxID=59201 RepID=A0A379UYE6_SALET|nr:acetylglutamate kinase [Salmonella enterica subsp. enterica]
MNPLLIKLGGVLLDSEEALERLFTALVNYRESHQRPLVIVHGGGCVVDELMKGLNLPVKKKDGLRVTPADQIGIITGALAGTANKNSAGLGEETPYRLCWSVSGRWRQRKRDPTR